MLSDQEKRELLEMAASAKIREDSRRLRASGRPRRLEDVDFAAALDFLTSIAQLAPAPPKPRPPVPYPQAKL